MRAKRLRRKPHLFLIRSPAVAMRAAIPSMVTWIAGGGIRDRAIIAKLEATRKAEAP